MTNEQFFAIILLIMIVEFDIHEPKDSWGWWKLIFECLRSLVFLAMMGGWAVLMTKIILVDVLGIR